MPQRKPHPLDALSFTVTPPPAPTPKPDPVPQSVPVVESDATRSSNVTLPVSVWEWIDAKHAEARSNGGAPLRKAAIIRAVFQVAMAAEVDLSGCQSDEEIAQRLKSAIVR